jgi:hypothetical protein
MNKTDILKHIGYPTIQRLFELENYKVNDMVISGVTYIIEHGLNLRPLDTTGRVLYKFPNHIPYAIIEYKIDDTKKIKEFEDDGTYVRVPVVKEEINVYSTKVIYVKILKH